MTLCKSCIHCFTCKLESKESLTFVSCLKIPSFIDSLWKIPESELMFEDIKGYNYPKVKECSHYKERNVWEMTMNH